MTVPATLLSFFEPWAEAYGNSSVLPTVIVFGHLAALLLAGGLAIALDRATLRAAAAPDLRAHQLDELRRGHRWVIGGIALSAVTGVLLFTADLETYYDSRIFWTKMALIAALLVNGYLMTRTESRLHASADATGWSVMRTRAMTSLVLWFAITLAGVALVNT